jgi:hypothetical protein
MEVEIIVFSKISHIQKAKYHSFVEPRTNKMMMMVMMGTNTNGGFSGGISRKGSGKGKDTER